MAKTAGQCSELLESISATNNEKERGNAGARIIEGWEQLVKTTASILIGKKLKVCNRAAKWWDEEVKEVFRVRREAHARQTSRKTAAGSEKMARKKVKEMAEKKGNGKTQLMKQMKTLMAG